MPNSFKKIFYIANIRIPTEKAHGIQIIETCAALVEEGMDVELVIPRRKNILTKDLFSYYSIPQLFVVTKLFTVDFLTLPLFKSFWFFIQTITFIFSLVIYTTGKKEEVFYGRDEMVMAALSYISKNVFWETHTGSTNIFAQTLMKRARGIVCISKGLADVYKQQGVSEAKLFVSPDAVNVHNFDSITQSKSELRNQLQLPVDKKIVTYSGSISTYSWKGVDVFMEAAGQVQDPSIMFMIVGGNQKDIDFLKQKYLDTQVLFIGKVEPTRVGYYLKASDVLVIPNKAGNIVSEKYTSPMKVFEYMASKVPIIASKLPSIEEILNTSSASLTEPNNPQKLAQAVTDTLATGSDSDKKAQQAYADVQEFTWKKRAQRIISFMRK